MTPDSTSHHSPDRLFVITGTTRGLGLALAKVCLSQGIALLTLSRQPSDVLDQYVIDHNLDPSVLTQLSVDLTDSQSVQAATQTLCSRLAHVKRPRLIHNAGVVTPITVSDQPASFADIHHAYLTNIVSPTYITNHFLAATAHSTGHDQTDVLDRRVMMISSGAARQAIAGWGVYCASKAALDRYAQVVALEQGPRVRIASVAPGVIDTPMQAQIRSTPSDQFPNVERFQALAQHGELASPDRVAQQLFTFIEHDLFGQQTIDDIRQHEF